MKEFKSGTDIDLVCNCRRFRGQDDAVLLGMDPKQVRKDMERRDA
ncbi:hypothetical protein [Prochlorococcus sp. MIT 0801]|nr:hypothetical protein [Prochlorococcus sp. MIT 0801]AIQ97414.1 hypothetical protein EW15_1322 [Prochlorococcus sp. MIT 0801]